MAKREYFLLLIVILIMAGYFIAATPVLMDDGEHYEGFAESLAGGEPDFKSFYGFQGLSILAVPVFWLTGSPVSIVITSIILFLLSLPLAYSVGRDFYGTGRAGAYFTALVLLMPYAYTTMMRGFQEAALLFFVLLVCYGALKNKTWVPAVLAYAGIVKPFALVLFPLLKNRLAMTMNRKYRLAMTITLLWWGLAIIIGAGYLGLNYYQTGHLVNNAAINSYQGNFDTGNPPPLIESFTLGFKGFLRAGANLLLHYRKVIVSPLIIILGGAALLKFKNLKLRREIILAVILNFLLVGGLTFSFSKYLLPMAILLALASVHYLLKYKWLAALVLVDSCFVFWPIWDYFGRNFWGNIWIYLIPLWLAAALFVIQNLNFKDSAGAGIGPETAK